MNKDAQRNLEPGDVILTSSSLFWDRFMHISVPSEIVKMCDICIFSRQLLGLGVASSFLIRRALRNERT